MRLPGPPILRRLRPPRLRLFHRKTPMERLRGGVRTVVRDASRRAAEGSRQAIDAVAPRIDQVAKAMSPSPSPSPRKTHPASKKAKSPAAPPRPSRRKARLAVREARAQARERRSEGLGFLGYALVAGLILAWPREGGSPLSRALRRLATPPPGVGPEADVAAAERAEPNRGRDAIHPLRIPSRGWRDIATRVWGDFGNDRIMATAGGVTFFALLAMFPAMGAFVSLYGLFADVHAARQQLSMAAGFIPHDVLTFVGDEMLRIAGGRHEGLGLAFALSLLFSLWSANGAVKALFDGLNVAYEERERRSFVRLNLVSLAFTAGALLFLMCAVAATVAAPVAMRFLRLDAGSVWLAELRWPVMLGLLAGGLSLLYRYGPSRERARWVWLTPGSLFAALMWLVASLAFSFYVANFGHFNATYGSLGAVIGFITWLWYSTIIVLIGGSLNSEIEHQTAVDTTTGPAKAMGERGAKMADTLGDTRAAAREKNKRPALPPQARMSAS